MIQVVIIDAVAIGLLGLLVCGLLRSHAEILRRLHELGAGLDPDSTEAPGTAAASRRGSDGRRVIPSPSAAPAFDVVGATLSDASVQVGVVGARQSTLLAFLSSGCAACAPFWDDLVAGGPLPVPGGARLLVVTMDPGEESESRIRELAPADGPVVMSSQAWRDYAVPGAPYFVYVDGPSGRVVGQGSAHSWQQVASLWSRALDDEALADRQLTRAGIHPGHPSLFQTGPEA